MNIIYGVSGEGFGHSSRAKKIISWLISKNHNVQVLTYGQALSPLKQFRPIKIPGIHLYFNKNNKMLLLKTASRAFREYILALPSFSKIKIKIDNFKPDLFITDYEPLTAIISHWYSLPLISIDNQHRLTHLSLKIPKKYKKDYTLARIATNLCVSKAEAFIILSFTKQKLKEKNAVIVSPILRDEIQRVKPSTSDYILVYQTKPSEKLILSLKSLNENFIVYGYDKSLKDGNIHYKKISPEFIKDLSKAKAVIASSGFTLMSESIYLGKPYYAIPLAGQFEQSLNAIFIKNAQIGDYSESPNKKDLENFIKNIHFYRKNLKKYKFNPNEVFEVLEKILKRINK